MTERAQLVEAALDVYPEGLALLDGEERVVFWNRAAETMTGWYAADVVGRQVPEALEPLMVCRAYEMNVLPRNGPQPGRGSLVHARHKSGGDVPAIARLVILRDDLGARIGTAAVFHPGEHLPLPHGETSECPEVERSQAEMEDRLESRYESFVREDRGLGVLWIAVDQARGMCRTHGPRACETMLESVERRLANGLRPGDEVGRWGNYEFLVLSEERSAGVLGAHALELAGLARTTQFSWWGDRLSVSVSIGAAAADQHERLDELLARTESAMMASVHAGGNHITVAPGRHSCSRS